MSKLQKYTEIPQLTQLAAMWGENDSHTFEELSSVVSQTHHLAQSGAVKAINQLMTLRNWLIGCYIVEYEQKGSDRAKYGDRLLKRLEESVNTRGLNETLFKVSRNFYLLYPQIGELLSLRIRPTVSDKFRKGAGGKGATASHQLETDDVPQKGATASHLFVTTATEILSKLSFSHIREIMTQDDPLARYFYETDAYAAQHGHTDRFLNGRSERNGELKI